MFELMDNIEFKIYKVSLRFYESSHRKYLNLPFLSQVLERLNDGAGRKQKSKYRTDSISKVDFDFWCLASFGIVSCQTASFFVSSVR